MAWQTSGPAYARSGAVTSTDASRAFMVGVYRWMFVGLGVTAGVALLTVSSPALLQMVVRAGWMLWVAQLGLVVVLSFGAQRLNPALAGALFLAYAGLNGLSFSFVFLVYQLGSLGRVFMLTAGTFGALSIYGAVTKRDLSTWGTFLFIGLFGIVMASIVNLIWPAPALTFVLSCASVLVFGGLTAYDNQKLRAWYQESGGANAAGMSINGALRLYLDFINLFLSLLRLFGRRN